MSATTQYDAIVIGAGQAGGPLSTALAQAGRHTAIIEREHVGGTCINEGCTPTKTMVASARVAHLVRRAADYGVHTGPLAIDLRRVRQRKRDIVTSFRSGSQSRIEQTDGLDLIFGEARFTSDHTLAIRLPDGDERTISAPLIAINAGERPAIPAIPGLADLPYLTSTTIMELADLPSHLLILGGGYIALEFGQMFRRFGSAVTIVQRGPQLLAREDPDVAEAVADICREDGITVLLQTEAVAAGQDGDDALWVRVRQADGREETLHSSHLLAAAGRRPNTPELQLGAAGIATDARGYIMVDDVLATNVAGIYALGDIKGGPAFTHISYDDFRILRTNIIDGGHASIKDRLVPYTVFIDPQLGRVGLSETDARRQGLNIRVAKLPMTSVARALEVDETRGFMKAIVDGTTQQILGAAVLGIEGGEVMAVLQMAMMGHVPYTTIRDGVFAHPTLSESLNNLFMALDEG